MIKIKVEVIDTDYTGKGEYVLAVDEIETPLKDRLAAYYVPVEKVVMDHTWLKGFVITPQYDRRAN